MRKVAVVGGGITGLTAAFYLQQAGLHPLLFDANASPGGVIRTGFAEGYRFEYGPSTLQENTPEIRDLIQALCLEGELVEAGPAAKRRYIVRDGKPRPLPTSPPAFFRTPLLSMTAKLRLLKEPYIDGAPGGREESVAEFARRRLGQEMVDYFVDPFVSGIYAGDAARLSLEHAFPRIHRVETEHGSIFRALVAAARSRTGRGRRSPRLVSFAEGLGQLPATLAARLQKSIYFNTPVTSIAAREGRWELIASRYDRKLKDRYDAVVLALPPDALAALPIENGGGAVNLSLLREIPQPPLVSVSLGFRREQIQHPLDGFGMLVPSKEGRGILGVIFASTLFPARAPAGDVLLTVFAGGVRQPHVAELPDGPLLDLILHDLRALLNVQGEPVFQKISRWARAIPQYEVGYGRFKAAIHSFEQANPGLLIAGTSRDGVALGQCIASGVRHAKRATDYLGALGPHPA